MRICRQTMIAVGTLLMLSASLPGAMYTWTGGNVTDGKWSSAGNWNATPVSVAGTGLVFNANTNGFNSVYDLAANPFLYSTMAFGSGLPALTVQSATTLAWDAGGWNGPYNNSAITQNSSNKVTIDAPIRITENMSVQFKGTGTGDLEFKQQFRTSRYGTCTVDGAATYNVILNQVDVIDGNEFTFLNSMPAATTRTLTVNGPVTANSPIKFYGVGRTVLNGLFSGTSEANLYPGSGGTVLLNRAAGNFAANFDLRISQGAGTVDLGGYTHTLRNLYIWDGATAMTNGTLQVQKVNFHWTQNKVLDATVNDAPGYSADFEYLTNLGQSNVWDGAMNVSGTARIYGGPITLRGANGAFTQSTFDIRTTCGNYSSGFTLDNTGSRNANRLSDTKPVSIEGGFLTLLDNATTPVVESIGDVTLGRQVRLSVDATAAGVSGFNGGSLTRADNAVLYLKADNLGQSIGGGVTSAGHIKFSAPVAVTAGTFGTPSAPIVPWAATNQNYNDAGGEYAQVVTYDAAGNGFRPLAASEHVTTPTAGANLFVTGNTALAGADLTIKSLTMRPAGSSGTYTLSGIASEKLTVTDGVIVGGMGANRTMVNQVTVPYLTFGPNTVTGYEGIIHVANTGGTVDSLIVDSAMVDNGANAVSLTKAGSRNLVLRGMNVIGGSLIVQDGAVKIQDNPNTVGVTETTTVGDVTINYSGTSATGIEIGAGSRLATTGAGTVLTINRPGSGTAVSGSGTLALSGGILIDFPTDITTATVTISPNVELGAGDRTIGITRSTGSLSGAIAGSGALTKVGAGTLTLTGTATHTGAVTIEAGALNLQGAAGGIPSNSSLTVNRGAKVLLDNASGNTNRLGDTAPVALGGVQSIGGLWSLKLAGNAASASTEQIGDLSFDGLNMIQIAPAGTVTRLVAADLERVGNGFMVVVGTSLGNASGSVAQFGLTTAPTLVGSGSPGTPTVGVYPLMLARSAISNGNNDWGYTSADTGLVTYDTTTSSFRRLNTSTECVGLNAAGSDNANIRMASTATISADKTIQSLAFYGCNVQGAANTTLTVTSGLIFHEYANGTYNFSVPYLTFGPNAVTGYEGIFYHSICGNTSARTFVSSVIRDNGSNPVSLTLAGPAQVWLSGANTYSGATRVLSGLLAISGADNRLPTGTVLTVGAPGQFDLNSLNQQIAGLSGAGTVGSSGTAADSLLTLAPAAGQSYDFAGVITNVLPGTSGTRQVALAVQGAGTQILSGANTYTGATTVGGTASLLVNGSLAAGVAPVTVAGGATLGGTGTISRSVTVSGDLAPGTSVGTLSITGTVIFADGGALVAELGRSGAADLLQITGNLDLGSNLDALELQTLGPGLVQGPYTLATFTAGRTGMFDAVYLDGLLITNPTVAGAIGGAFNLEYGTNSILIIPEPAALTLLALAATAGVTGRRRRALNPEP